MPKHRRKGHMRKGKPVRPATVTTKGSGPNAPQPADSVAAVRSAQTGQPSSETPSDLDENLGVVVWQTGKSAIDYLIKDGRLESVSERGREQAADRLIQDASKRLDSARRLMESDTGSAFSLAYDAYRMAADSLLALQCLRATGGDGSHRILEDAISAQFGNRIPSFSKPRFEQFRQMRNASQYPDYESPDLTDSDAQWAIDLAGDAVSGAQDLTGVVELGPYRPSS
ncbi:hypothetical protein [Candidatus Poriferisodalis sp.]|uniref:hypothetical protein n=1 Tax=Candidatus Poriferisodalis sp. TaxID=3101277 RepID=UPI003B516B32